MGLGDAFKKVSGIAKSTVGQIPGIGSLTTGGNGLGALGGLMGKKPEGTPDSYVPLDPLQIKALGKYDNLLSENTDNLAKNTIAKQENQIRSNAMDMERKATDLVAQRGLGKSSVGLNAIINSSRNMGDQIGATRAALPGLQYDMKVSNLNNASNGINSIFNTRIFKQGTPAGPRQGGLLPILGAGLGAAFGGPGGAGVGMGLGNAFNQMG